ncbi:MAG: glycosyltransferase family 2 protein [Blastochloris sp.]|nr:glycosyltransferase family 2 protein [Blastochloris sp.]
MDHVSVVVAASQATPFIGEAIDSVFLQKYPKLELLVVGDDLQDNGRLGKILAQHGSSIVFVENVGGGLAAARNAGCASATGDLIAILDPSDVWEPDYLRIQLDALQSNPSADVVYSNASFFGDAHLNAVLYMDRYPSHGPVTFESVCWEHCNILGASLFRRDRLLAVGGYDLRVPASGIDFDLFLRLLHAGAEVVYHGHPVYRMRRSADSRSEIEEMKSKLVLVDVLSQLAETLDLTASQRHALDARLDRLRARLSVIDGKNALNTGDWPRAKERLRFASQYDPSVKLGLVRLATAVCPGALSRLMRWRAEHMAGR